MGDEVSVEREKKKEERVSPYRLKLEPNKEMRRPEWNLILISNIAVTVNFYHTDMLEKVIAIRDEKVEEKKEGIKEG